MIEGEAVPALNQQDAKKGASEFRGRAQSSEPTVISTEEQCPRALPSLSVATWLATRYHSEVLAVCRPLIPTRCSCSSLSTHELIFTENIIIDLSLHTDGPNAQMIA